MPTNTKRADMESAPTANNVILIHTVGVDVLDDPLQRDVTFVSNAGSFRQAAPATFLPEEGYCNRDKMATHK